MSDLEIKEPKKIKGMSAGLVAFWERDWREIEEKIKYINKLLKDGVEVTTANGADWNSEGASNLTHKALLINIQPIKQKTREDMVIELLGKMFKDPDNNIKPIYEDRLKELLGPKNE